jgi:hypothetical protein
MALQRTRRPSLCSGRSLRSLGSPLNALPLGASSEIIHTARLPLQFLGASLVITALLWPASASAQPRLIISTNPCAFEVCPCCIRGITSVASGTPFGFGVFPVDATNALAETYTGTVLFSSTDPLASLPASYSFLPSDQGRRHFSVVLRTPGVQQITVTDSTNALAPGVLEMTVTGHLAPLPIPTFSSHLKIILGAGLAFSGIWLLRMSG